MSLPIDYQAIIRTRNSTVVFDLDESGWMQRPELKEVLAFALVPKEGVTLPSVTVDLSPFPDGTRKQWVYTSRVFGRLTATESGGQAQHNLFRLYCLGWKASIMGRQVKSLLWVYPNGAIVAADNPPFIDEMIEAGETNRLIDETIARAEGKPDAGV